MLNFLASKGTDLAGGDFGPSGGPAAKPVSVLTFDTEMDQITGERAKTKLSVAWRRFWQG